MKSSPMKSYRLSASVLAIAGFGLPLAAGVVAQSVPADAHAQGRYHNPHWVLDERYHHNHYYPAPGYSMTVLPSGNVGITFRSGRFFYHSGVWFRASGSRYVVVRPPVGIVAPVLPPGYTTIWSGGVPYYYANDVYYVQGPGGYVVAEAPAVTVAPPVAQPVPPTPYPPQAVAPPTYPPQAAVPVPYPQSPTPGPAIAAQTGGGTWYFCQSSNAYYPYVPECKEGWRTVPAAPPPSR